MICITKTAAVVRKMTISGKFLFSYAAVISHITTGYCMSNQASFLYMRVTFAINKAPTLAIYTHKPSDESLHRCTVI